MPLKKAVMQMDSDLHVHIMMDGENYKQATARHKNGVDKQYVREVLETYSKLGVKFLRDGGDAYGVSEYAKSIAPEYSIEYLTPVFAIHKKGLYGSIVGRAFTDMKEYALLVNEAKTRGCDFIKVMSSGILDFDVYGSISAGALALGEITEMVKIANAEGFSVMCHVNGAENMKNALEAGVGSVEHGYYADEESIKMFTQTGAVWVPTVSTCMNLLRTDRFDRETVLRIIQTHAENISRGIKAGVNIGSGSDAGAYSVPHETAANDEYMHLKEIIKDDKILYETLKKSENLIKERFGGK